MPSSPIKSAAFAKKNVSSQPAPSSGFVSHFPRFSPKSFCQLSSVKVGIVAMPACCRTSKVASLLDAISILFKPQPKIVFLCFTANSVSFFSKPSVSGTISQTASAFLIAACHTCQTSSCILTSITPDTSTGETRRASTVVITS